MPLDALCLSALTKELSPVLTGARIDKVQQPERDLLLLSLYTRDGNRRLLISSNVGGARLHLTESRPENPEAPPMFCMLLRKHLVGARITGMEQPPRERLVLLRLACRDELGVATEKTLAVELMGRAANVILVDGEGHIIDCLRRMDFGEEAVRRMLPGMRYRLPPKQKKPNFFELSGAERARLWQESDNGSDGDKRLLDTFTGLSPLIARELSYRAGEDNMEEAMEALCEAAAAGEAAPYMLMENGVARDFSFMSINQYGSGTTSRRYPDFSSLLDDFYSGRDRQERMRRLTADTQKAVRTLRDRQTRKLAGQRRELLEAGNREEGRKQAQLLTANLYRVRQGDRVLKCEDYFSQGCPEIEIPLDPLKTPQQNAAALFRDYRKKTGAERHLTELIADGEKRLDYLESVLCQLSLCQGERDVSDIRRELAETGVLKKQRSAGKGQKLKPRSPLSFRSDAGLEILAGRSNGENDQLTFKTARRSDMWFHAQKLHGSHVILRCGEREADQESMAQAAAVAAYYSEGRSAGRVNVDCCLVKYVKKPSGALPGKVVYTDYTTISASPDDAPDVVRQERGAAAP